MRFGTWNVRSLYRTGPITAAAMDLVGVQGVRWEKEGTVKAGDCHFIYAKGNEKNPNWEQNFFCASQNKSAVK